MPIVLLCAEGRSAIEIARVLFCSRTTVYAIEARFIWEEKAAFNDRKRRGPKPLLEELANEYIEPSVWGSMIWWSSLMVTSRSESLSGSN